MYLVSALFLSILAGFLYARSIQALLYNPFLTIAFSFLRMALCGLFFFYLLHLPLIHFILTLITFLITLWSLLLL